MTYVEQLIRQTAFRYGVDPDLAVAVARQESGLNQAARGRTGEVGVFQLMPGTAAGLGVNPYDLADNVDGGVRYLAEQYRRFGSWDLALAAYNAGPGRVSAGLIPASTERYVVAVLSAFYQSASPAPAWPAWPGEPAESADVSAGLLAALAVGAMAVVLLVV